MNTNQTPSAADRGSELTEGLGPLVERLLKYSDIRRNDPRENREALRDLIVGELADELRAARAAERERCVQWLRNHYQDQPNIASICDAMRARPNVRGEPGHPAQEQR